MQDPKSQDSSCKVCGAEPGSPCVGADGEIMERVHWGRPNNGDPITATYCHTCGQPYVGECRNTELHRKIERFRNTPRETASDEQWAAEHTGRCAYCLNEARLYPEGWRCSQHPPVGSRA
jgi:hypothetical protein